MMLKHLLLFVAAAAPASAFAPSVLVSQTPIWQSSRVDACVCNSCAMLLSSTGQFLAAVPFKSTTVPIFGGSRVVSSWSLSPVATLGPPVGNRYYVACTWSPTDAYICCTASDAGNNPIGVFVWKTSAFASSGGAPVSPIVTFTTENGYNSFPSLGWSPDGRFLAFGEDGYSGSGIRIYGGKTADPMTWNTTSYLQRLTGLQRSIQSITWFTNGKQDGGPTYIYAGAPPFTSTAVSQAVWGGSNDDPTTWSSSPLKAWGSTFGSESNPTASQYVNGFLMEYEAYSYATVIYGNGKPDPTAWSTTPTLQLNSTNGGALSPDGRYLAMFYNIEKLQFYPNDLIFLFGGSLDISSWNATSPVAIFSPSKNSSLFFSNQIAWGPDGKVLFGLLGSDTHRCAVDTVVVVAYSVTYPPSASPSPSPATDPPEEKETIIAAAIGGSLAALAVIGGLFYGYKRLQHDNEARVQHNVQNWAGDHTVINAYAAGRVTAAETATQAGGASTAAYAPL